MMLENLSSARYLSATKQFAVFFVAEPLTARRLPVSMYAVIAAVDAGQGDRVHAEEALCSALEISPSKARELVQAAIRVGLLFEEDEHAA